MSTINQLLPRLMAMENLRVEFQNVPTAAFDLQNRVLILPKLREELLPEVTTLFIGHEVGHALETPAAGWHNELDKDVLKGYPNEGKGFKSFLNVVEDARIERKIKTRYPGLRKDFAVAYKDLWDKEFFGPEAKVPDLMLLIDRINLHYKVGHHALPKFSPEEKPFLARIDKAETWPEVVQIAKDLYEYCKEELKDKLEELEKRREELSSAGDGEDGEDGGGFEMDFDDWDDSDEDADSEASGKAKKGKKQAKGSSGDGDEDDEDGEKTEKTSRGATLGGSKHSVTSSMDLESVTDRQFAQNSKSVVAGGASNTLYVDMPKLDCNDFIVSHKKVVNVIDIKPYYTHEGNAFQNALNEPKYPAFKDRNQKYINYLVKEFELRKNAQQNARAKESKTGMIDVNKLYSYRFNDQIFKSITTVPHGKNHGMVMVIDWSGSMQGHLAATIEQTLALVHFCKKVNIPYRVYAFLSYHLDKPVSGIDDWALKQKISKIAAESTKNIKVLPFCNMQMAELLTSDMSKVSFNKMQQNLLNIAATFETTRGRDSKNPLYGGQLAGLPLNGTPLNEAIWVLRFIIEEFKKARKIELVSAIVLSDGDGVQLDTSYKGAAQRKYGEKSTVYTDVATKNQQSTGNVQSYRTGARNEMAALAALTGKITGARMIGFYLYSSNYDVRSFAQGFENGEAVSAMISEQNKTNKFASITCAGFDEYYLIKSENMKVDNEELTVDSGATKAKILTAFKKNQHKKILNRVLLNRFMRSIADR